jgi:uncharacterized membrane protein YjjP (DUF1212 family)
MITNLAKKIVSAYDNLTPKRKALVDLVCIMLSAVIGASIIVTILNFGLWLELAIAFICYGIWGMVSLLYKSRVEHYEFQEKYNKK